MSARVISPLEYTMRTVQEMDSIRDDLKRVGVSVVKLYDEDHPTMIEYHRGMEGLSVKLRPDGGTAHGARGMGGIVKPYAGGCDPAAARVRLDDEARKVHAGVYGTPVEDTMSSWDAVGILGTDAERKTMTESRSADAHKRFESITGSTLKPHVDVGYGSKGHIMEEKMRDIHPNFHACIQSQFVCKSVVSGGATLVVSPGPWYSTDRRDMTTLFDMSDGKDFCCITEEGHRRLASTWRCVEAPRGCLVVWISQLPHTNKLADLGVDPRRLVVFISWQSRRLVSVEERQTLKRKKMEAIFSGATTDHWATHVPKMHRGNHYSNRHRQTKVLYTKNDPPIYEEYLQEKIEGAF